jgi:hypothetical protein
MDINSQNGLPKSIMNKSEMFRKEAEKYGFAYFDISPDRNTALKEAYDYLLN